MPPPPAQLTVAREFQVRRSELTCPGHSLKMMTKAADSSADEVILDLEDAVAVSQKVEARRTVVEALTSLDFRGKVRAYRVNGLRTPWCYRDVIEVVEAAGRFVDVVVVPKVDGPEDVHFIDRLLTQVELAAGLDVGRIRLEVLIESAKGLLAAERIATASPRLASLIFGIADYAGDVGARDFKDAPYERFVHARSHLVAAARAAGLNAIDAVTVQFRDLEKVRADAEAGAQLGFDGKWAIHPSHLEPIHAAYTPSRAELERALAILEAYRKADVEQGTGAIVFGDEMVDAASLRVEWRKLAVARRAGLLDAQDRLVDLR
ncbi:MAG: CoA ester lyase [Myxococcaceae bacterium]|nr:CoA ester lyase [Myxococcaceae bacterium]MCI0669665.1 CoA ester lyase [Myxococcaceae bacterium]